MGEGGAFTSHAWVLLPSELLSQYSNTGAFLKMMIMIEHIKIMQIPYLDI